MGVRRKSIFPEMLYPPTGAAEEGAVFLVRHAAGEPSVWTVVRYEPAAYRIAYVRVTPGSDTARIEVDCADGRDGTTRAEVTYTFTTLAERGNAAIEQYSEAHFGEWIASWGVAINQYLLGAASAATATHQLPTAPAP
jgi:hypothetical protein